MAQHRFEVVFRTAEGLDGRKVIVAGGRAVAMAEGLREAGPGGRVLGCAELGCAEPGAEPGGERRTPRVPVADAATTPEPHSPPGAVDVDRLLRGLEGMRRGRAEEAWVVAAGVAKGALIAAGMLCLIAALSVGGLGALIIAPSMSKFDPARDEGAASAMLLFGGPTFVLLVTGLLCMVAGGMARRAMLRYAEHEPPAE